MPPPQAPTPATVTRCDIAIVQLVVTTYDAEGRPIREQTSEPIKVFRGAAPDFWADADRAVAALQGAPCP